MRLPAGAPLHWTRNPRLDGLSPEKERTMSSTKKFLLTATPLLAFIAGAVGAHPAHAFPWIGWFGGSSGGAHAEMSFLDVYRATFNEHAKIIPEGLYTLIVGGGTVSEAKRIEICHQANGKYTRLLRVSPCVNSRVDVTATPEIDLIPAQQQECNRGNGADYGNVCVYKDGS